MTEGLAGSLGLNRSSGRRIRLFHKLWAKGISVRYVLICTKARHTARLRALSERFDILWMLLFTRLAPLTRRADKARYALCSALASIEAAVNNGCKGALRSIRYTVAVIPSAGKRMKHARLNMSLLCCATAIVFMATSFFGVGLEVIVDGVSLGFVTNQHDFEAAVDNVSEKATELLGRPYTLFASPVYQFSFVNRNLIFNRSETEEMLLGSIPDLKQLYVLTVDGVSVAASSEYTVLRDTLDKKLEQYSLNDSNDSVTFYQDVKIEHRLAAASLEYSQEELEDLLLSDLRPTVTHVVEKGDTLRSIASGYGISEEALISLNPALAFDDEDSKVSAMTGPYVFSYDDNGDPVQDDAIPLSDSPALPVGETLVVGESIPYLSVCVTRQVSYTEAIPYETDYVKDDEMFDGDTRVVSDGIDGQLMVYAELRLLNGSEVDRTVIDTAVMSEPVAEVVAEGTRVRYALGNFIRPYSGVLTSGYGNRYLFGKWDFHSGIDLAGPTGGSIVASDGGKVIFAGWQNGYGNLVIIDHQNGYKTAYAHCSKLLVKVDQMVAQREEIAKVGSTGVSTGPHLHFEIRTNNGTINPLKLIGK